MLISVHISKYVSDWSDTHETCHALTTSDPDDLVDTPEYEMHDHSFEDEGGVEARTEKPKVAEILTDYVDIILEPRYGKVH